MLRSCPPIAPHPAPKRDRRLLNEEPGLGNEPGRLSVVVGPTGPQGARIWHVPFKSRGGGALERGRGVGVLGWSAVSGVHKRVPSRSTTFGIALACMIDGHDLRQRDEMTLGSPHSLGYYPLCFRLVPIIIYCVLGYVI